MNNDNVIKLSYPLVLETNEISNNLLEEKIDTIKNEETVDLFNPELNAKPFSKPERKNKKNEKGSTRDSDIVKTKLKSKKKEN